MNQNLDHHFDTTRLRDDLRGRSVRAGAVTISSQGAIMALNIGSLAILGRLLSPQEFGIVAMVTAFTTLVGRIKDGGLSASTVQQAEINHAQVSTLFWVNAGLGTALGLITAAAAPLIAIFYDQARVGWITLAVGSVFFFYGLGVQHSALLRRQMRFTELAVAEVGSTLIGIIAAIVAALLGASYWALVLQLIAGAFSRSVILWIQCDWRPGSPVRGCGVRPMLMFGSNLTVTYFIQSAARNVDNILLGVFTNPYMVGLYSKAYQLMLLPVQQLSTPVSHVAMPALSRLQNDPELYRLYYKKGMLLLTMVGMPLAVYTFVDAENVIGLVLGEKWLPMTTIFRFLAPAVFMSTFQPATGWVYLSLGRTDRQLKWALFGSSVRIAGIVAGLPWGAHGVALGSSAAICLTRIPGIHYCFRGTPLKLKDLLLAIWRPSVASILAGIGLFGLMQVPVIDALVQSPLAAVPIDATIYLVLYALLWIVLPNGRRSAMELLDILKDFKVRKPATG